MNRVKTINVIKGKLPRSLTHKLQKEVESFIINHSDKPIHIVLVSSFIKMEDLHNLVHGDRYFNLKLDIIHPFDKVVRSLDSGIVERYTFEEFADSIPFKEDENIYLFFDSPNLTTCEPIAKLFKHSPLVEEATIAVLKGKEKFAYKALFPFKVENTTKNIDVNISII